MNRIRSKTSHFLLDIIEIFFISVLVFGLVYFFVGLPLKITGDSMYPTFKNDEQILSEKISLKFTDPQKGKIYVFNHPLISDRLLIKRLIAEPGDVFKLIEGDVYINNELIEEHYINDPHSTHELALIKDNAEFVVPKNEYIFMGDNRLNSADSREFGTIKKENIVGKVFVVYYPLTKFRLINFTQE